MLTKISYRNPSPSIILTSRPPMIQLDYFNGVLYHHGNNVYDIWWKSAHFAMVMTDLLYGCTRNSSWRINMGTNQERAWKVDAKDPTQTLCIWNRRKIEADGMHTSAFTCMFDMESDFYREDTIMIELGNVIFLWHSFLP